MAKLMDARAKHTAVRLSKLGCEGDRTRLFKVVMAGRRPGEDPAIHVFPGQENRKRDTWMPGSRPAAGPGMTRERVGRAQRLSMGAEKAQPDSCGLVPSIHVFLHSWMVGLRQP